MAGKKQQSEQEAFRAATPILIRAIILAAIVALAVSNGIICVLIG